MLVAQRSLEDVMESLGDFIRLELRALSLRIWAETKTLGRGEREDVTLRTDRLTIELLRRREL